MQHVFSGEAGSVGDADDIVCAETTESLKQKIICRLNEVINAIESAIDSNEEIVRYRGLIDDAKTVTNESLQAGSNRKINYQRQMIARYAKSRKDASNQEVVNTCDQLTTKIENINTLRQEYHVKSGGWFALEPISPPYNANTLNQLQNLCNKLTDE